MATASRGLGRGIDSLFRNQSEPARDEEAVLKVAPSRLFPNPNQPRKVFDEAALDELAASIKTQGLLQPILVRGLPGTGNFEIVAGERRWRAATRASLAEVPVLVRELSDDEVLVVALVENLQREDLNPLEEAEAMSTLRESLGLSQEELAARLGKSRSAVANSLRLLQLETAMRDALGRGEITPGHARALLALARGEARDQLFAAIREHRLSVRDAESAVLAYKENGAFPLFGGSTEPDPAAPSCADAANGGGNDPGSEADSVAQIPDGKADRFSRASRLPKPEAVRAVQALLRAGLHPKATVSGSGELGRVTIPYESAEQLSALLSRLGLSGDEHA